MELDPNSLPSLEHHYYMLTLVMQSLKRSIPSTSDSTGDLTYIYNQIKNIEDGLNTLDVGITNLRAAQQRLNQPPHTGGKRRRSVKKSTKKSKKVHTGGKRNRSVKKSTNKSKKALIGGKRRRSVKKSRK